MNETINTWENMNVWRNVMPPSRPDYFQLYKIKEFCKYKKVKKVAVLGSTVEYRDLLVELGVEEIYIFENNLSYYKEVSKSRRHDAPEELVYGDWRSTISQYKNIFDLVLSDLTSGNLPYAARNDFYKDIAESLSDTGYYIDRVLTKPIAYLKVDYLIEKYKRLDVTLRNVNDFNCEVIFCSDLLEHFKGVLDTSLIYDKLLNMNVERITEFVKACYMITPRDCRWWYSVEWNEESEWFLKHFSLEAFYDEMEDSPYYERAKLFVFEKKRK